MAAHEFRDDDESYLNWLDGHPDGYVINTLRSHNPTTAKVHRASCWTINGVPAHGGTWTSGDYVKVCADQLADLDQWARDRVGESIQRCGTCHPAGAAARPA
ncbi:hypothetical protein [Mycolicibacter sinensis]|uniref:hypothetical protein n=1 Tax=Mycolicibacter sinensis (strain JDM601) TaxID=875328 RepID=UPI000A9AB64E|nr:hypothetical protein [Mycolicibacter sinensis]